MIQSRTVNRKLALLAAALMIAPSGAYANPLGGQLVGGQASIAGQGTKTVTVTQGSNSAILNWNTFNIGSGELTQFIQPSATSIALNRVIGNLGPSQIDGHLAANGRVFLVNPYGFLFGSGAQINVAGLLATTNDIRNEDFMAGHYNFNIPGRPDASIVNLGSIHITPSSTGFAALVAPGVRNAGVITANLGKIGLASGNGFTLDFYGDKLITLQVGDQIAHQVLDVATGKPLKSLVSNEGTLKANGGQVSLTAVAARTVVDSVINNTGVVEANSIGTKNGMIVLGAATAADKGSGAPVQAVKVSGTLSAKGRKAGSKGGKVQITGEQISLNSAKLDASGAAGGGRVQIGRKGDNPSTTVTIDNTSLIDASAKANGDGGNVVVWSNGTTSVTGSIVATGGALGGNGGTVETSGQTVNFAGISVDTSAPNGSTGMWLIDPTNLVVDSEDAATISGALKTTSVTLQTNKDGSTTGPGDPHKGPGDIDITAPITWSTNSSLTLSAYNSININANITSWGGGAVTLRADNTGTGWGTVTFGYTQQRAETDRRGDDWGWDRSYAKISTSGDVTIFYNPSDGYAGNKSSTIWGNPYSQFVTGDGHLTAYMLVNDVGDLQNIAINLHGIYALGRNVDASATAGWNEGQGFVPIGQPGNGFDGKFDGFGNTIDGLTIAPTNSSVVNIGLFGANYGTIANVNLTDITVKANPNANGPSQYVGTLVGQNFGMISDVTVTGSINSGSESGVIAGGLVGQNSGRLIRAYGEEDEVVQTFVPGVINNASANVSVHIGDGASCTDCNGGWNYAGGLVGVNAGVVTRSAAMGDVTSGANSFAGGLVGANQDVTRDSSFTPRIANSFATGSVAVGAGSGAGGLVGENDGKIKYSHAIGAVTGTNNSKIGGLAGDNAGRIGHSWASGDLTSDGTNVTLGGLVGFNTGAIAKSYASGSVSAMASSNVSSDCSDNSCAQNVVGGLVGWNDGTIRKSSVGGQDDQTPTVSVGSQGIAGGLVGFNGVDGRIWRTHSSANVIGAPGVSSSQDVFNQVTFLGGLVGQNRGFIGSSSASGSVGTVGVDFLEAGGLVAKNNGTISHSRASGDVAAGDFSAAGGLVAQNNPGGENCGDCAPAESATISHAAATGNVTVGVDSVAAGLVAINQGTVSDSHAGSATSTVTGGANSILGGFAAINDLNGVINTSTVLGALASTGPNASIGGFAGVNGGNIENSQTGTAVIATSSSYVGGFVGINIGTVVDSQVIDPASVTVTDSGNLVGGFVGMNIGAIDPSTTVVTPQAAPGTTNIVGGFAGANFNFANADFNGLTLPAPTFPTGTISTNSNTTDSIHPFIGTDIVTSGPSTPPPPAPPAIINQCNDPLCAIVAVLPLTPLPPQQPPPDLQPPPDDLLPPPDNLPSEQNSPPPNGSSPLSAPPPALDLIVPPGNIFTNNDQPVLINLTTGGTGGTGAGGNGRNGGFNNRSPGPPPGPGLGRTYDEQHFSGVPPIGETRFKSAEIVVQIVDAVTLAQVQALAQQFGITLISSEHLPNGRVLYRFGFASGTDIRRLILALEHKNIIASVQPNYVFGFAQSGPTPKLPHQEPPPNDTTGSLPPPGDAVSDLANTGTASLETLPAGDSAQYVINKLHLAAVHRIASGRNVTVAVVDSEIDINHADLKGVVMERYDATQSESHPHVHGTGMAGAIASRSRLLGVAPDVRIFAIKAFDEQASSAEGTSYQILKGLDHAIEKHVRIINMSFAGPRDPMMERTLKTAHDNGIILVAAAGNAGPKSLLLYPGADPSVIAVTATDYTDKPFIMANRGKYIAVAAPGVDVMVPAPGNTYQLTTGTSVAAAHVSGVAALLVERKPTITPDEVRSLLMHTAHAMNVRGKDELDGAGLVDPMAALSQLLAPKSTDQPPRVSPGAASVH